MAQIQPPIAASPEAPKAPKKKWKKLLIRMIMLMLLLGVIAGAYFAVKSIFFKGKKTASGAPVAPVEKKIKPEDLGMIPLRTVIVNLSDTTEGIRAAKITITLGCTDKKLTEEYEKQIGLQAVVMDTVNMVISAKSSAELLTPKGKEKLKKELKDTLNAKLGGTPIEDVYFIEFIIQL